MNSKTPGVADGSIRRCLDSKMPGFRRYLGANQHPMVALHGYRCNCGVLKAEICTRISSRTARWSIASAMPQKQTRPAGGCRGGRIERCQGIGGGAAPIGVRKLATTRSLRTVSRRKLGKGSTERGFCLQKIGRSRKNESQQPTPINSVLKQCVRAVSLMPEQRPL